MRSDIINEVLSVEDRAQKIVKDAGTTARGYISDAQSRANELIRSALKAEREVTHTQLERAEADAATQLFEFEKSLDVSTTLDEQSLENIACDLVRLICLTELDTLQEG